MQAGQNRIGVGNKKMATHKSHIERRALNNRRQQKGKKTNRDRDRERKKRIINSKMPSGHSIKPNEKLKDSCAPPA